MSMHSMTEFSGKQYLKIDVANQFGLDKDEWHERIEWFDANADKLESLVPAAESPAQFHAAVRAWRKTERAEPSGYTISLDATASGMQLLACLTGDRSAAMLCNVVYSGKREDAYTAVYEKMVSLMPEGASPIDRKDLKSALMTALYGSKAQPREVFGEGPMLDLFYAVVTQMMPGAWTLNEALLELWDPNVDIHEWVLPDNFHVKVKVMGEERQSFVFDGKTREVRYKVNKPTEQGKSLAANTVHSVDGMVVREMGRRCMFNPAQVRKLLDLIAKGVKTRSARRANDQLVLTLVEHYKASGFLSARIIDLLDEENIGLVDHIALTDLLCSLPKKPFEVVAIHDCFRCMANYGNDLRRQYAQILSEIAKSDLLGFLVPQIAGAKGWQLVLEKFAPVIDKLDPDMWKDVLNTEYALS